MANLVTIFIAFVTQWFSTTAVLLFIYWIKRKFFDGGTWIFVLIYWLTCPISWILGGVVGLEAANLLGPNSDFGHAAIGFFAVYIIPGFLAMIANAFGGLMLFLQDTLPWLLTKFRYAYSRLDQQIK